MRTRRRIVLVLLALALGILAVPLGAASAKGGPKPPPDGVTCEEYARVYGGLSGTFVEVDGFTITVSAGFSCVDWTTSDAGHWKVVVEEYPTRSFSGVMFAVKDSQPGDLCWEFADAELTKRQLDGGLNTLTSPMIPAAAVDACGSQSRFSDTGAGNEQLVFMVASMMPLKAEGTVTIRVEPTTSP